jgi:hypothetical protein
MNIMAKHNWTPNKMGDVGNVTRIEVEFSKIFIQAFNESKLSGRAFGRFCGISEQIISMVLSGRRRGTGLDTVVKVAKAINYDLNKLKELA